MSKSWELLESVASRSRPGVSYEIRRGGDGRVYCTCPAWAFSRGHVCKHLAARRARGVVEPVADPRGITPRMVATVQYRAPQRAVSPRRVPVVEQDPFAKAGGKRGKQ